jgi:hypothetical protein
MSSENTKPKLTDIADSTDNANNNVDVEKQLDAEEEEFRAIRCDVPGVKGASAAGIVAISVDKVPTKNEFFRTHADFRPIVPIVNVEVGIERQFFAVTPDMIEPLGSIGITVSNFTLYLTITSMGALRVIPVRTADENGDQNEYDRTRELGLIQAVDEWVRLYTDRNNSCYRVYTAPRDRFPANAAWPELKSSKVFRLAFRDKGRLLDSVEHPLFKKWAARDAG